MTAEGSCSSPSISAQALCELETTRADDDDDTADAVGVVVDTYHVWWDPDLRAQVLRAGTQGRLASY